MRWVAGERLLSCRISDALVACVWLPADIGWFAAIDVRPQRAGSDCYPFHVVTEFGPYLTEAEARAAVAAWIGKTMAQFGNALRAGETMVDEE